MKFFMFVFLSFNGLIEAGAQSFFPGLTTPKTQTVEEKCNNSANWSDPQCVSFCANFNNALKGACTEARNKAQESKDAAGKPAGPAKKPVAERCLEKSAWNDTDCVEYCKVAKNSWVGACQEAIDQKNKSVVPKPADPVKAEEPSKTQAPKVVIKPKTYDPATCKWKPNGFRKIISGPKMNNCKEETKFCVGEVVCDSLDPSTDPVFPRKSTCDASLCHDAGAAECSSQPGFGSFEAPDSISQVAKAKQETGSNQAPVVADTGIEDEKKKVSVPNPPMSTMPPAATATATPAAAPATPAPTTAKTVVTGKTVVTPDPQTPGQNNVSVEPEPKKTVSPELQKAIDEQKAAAERKNKALTKLANDKKALDEAVAKSTLFMTPSETREHEDKVAKLRKQYYADVQEEANAHNNFEDKKYQYKIAAKKEAEKKK